MHCMKTLLMRWMMIWVNSQSCRVFLTEAYLGIVAIPSSIHFLSFTYKGGVLYLQAQLKSKTEILREEISFFVKGIYTLSAYINTVSCGHLIEHRLIHSTQHLTLHENAATPLLVISPKHGSVEYKWKKKVSFLSNEWRTIEVPSWTCLLYVTTATQYRCTVESSMITFDVTSWSIYVCIIVEPA